MPQRVGPEVALGAAGFADDTAPRRRAGRGARRRRWLGARRVAGRSAGGGRQGAGPAHDRRRSVIRSRCHQATGRSRCGRRGSSPAYLETDASWCVPGGEPASPLANGGAFGGKAASIAPTAARDLADRYGRPVRVVLSREDTVRLGAKRPPIAAGVRADGTGIVRVVRTARDRVPGFRGRAGRRRRPADIGRAPRCGLGRGRDPAGRAWRARRASNRRPARWRRRRSTPTACTSTSPAAIRSTRSCCGPTASAPPTWRWAGSGPRASRSTKTASRTISRSARSASCAPGTCRRCT